jgi:hypothetical protein
MKNEIKEWRQPLSMSSREIAELLEVRHDNVKRTVERLADRGVIEFPPTEDIPTATKPMRVYHLEKRDSYVVVAQLSPEFTARLVDRWQELESQAGAIPNFSDASAESVIMWLLSGRGPQLSGGGARADLSSRSCRDEVDLLEVFLVTSCEVTGHESDFILSRDLIEAFNTWLEMQGQPRWGLRTVSNRLTAKESEWRHPETGKAFASVKRAATGKRGLRLSESFVRDMMKFRLIDADQK